MSEPEKLGVLQLIWSDYERHSDYKAQHPDLQADSRTRMLLMALPRFVTNSSLRAVVLVRLALGSPRWLAWFWNSLLVWLHSSELMHGCQIGPRLSLPHPWGVCIGSETTIGHDATIAMNVAIGADIPARGQPVIGDNVIILSNASIFGDVTIGDGAVVGAMAMVREDVPPGGIAAAPKARIIEPRPGASRDWVFE